VEEVTKPELQTLTARPVRPTEVSTAYTTPPDLASQGSRWKPASPAHTKALAGSSRLPSGLPAPRLRTQKPWFSSPLEPSRVLQTRPTLCLIRAVGGAAVAHLKVEEAVTVTVSMRVMSAGDGYQYLLRTVAAADGDRSLSTPLTRYYAEAANPPGRGLGSGVHTLGSGELHEGDEVSEAQLQLLDGMGRDPLTGEPLGRAYPEYRSVSERIDERVKDLDSSFGPIARGREIAVIEAEETARGSRRAAAGFDYTFSIPKSASVLWAVADAGTQALIAQAHHAAVAEMVAFIEREVAATRVGATGLDGAVAQVNVTGVVATAFDHYDSRAGDPHLHTHVVISN